MSGPVIFAPILNLEFGNHDTVSFQPMSELRVAQRYMHMVGIARRLKEHQVASPLRPFLTAFLPTDVSAMFCEAKRKRARAIVIAAEVNRHSPQISHAPGGIRYANSL
jgi:hypothetical protein